MLDFLTRKQKGILSTITILGLGAIIAKGLYDYSTYKILKNIDRQFKKNSWEYYD